MYRKFKTPGNAYLIRFIYIQCSDALAYITDPSRYLIGNDTSVTSFQSAMDKCLSLGSYSNLTELFL